MNTIPIVSVIVPCYNVADCVESTIMSVMNQTDSRFELILVNDGSTDNTVSVVEALKNKYSVIKLLNKSNGGVSSARNAGLKLATAPYVYFLDGDDYIVPTFIADIANVVEGQDVIVFGSLQERGKNKMRYHLNNFSKDYLLDYLRGEIYIHNSSCVISRAMIYKYDLHFDEHTYYSEDREFIVNSLFRAKTVGCIPKILFHYKWRSTSAMNRPVYTRRRITSIYAWKRIYKALEGKQDYQDWALIQVQMCILLHIRSYLRFKCEDNELWSELQSNWKMFNRNSGIYLGRYAMFVQAMYLFNSISPKLMYFFLKAF